MGLVEVGRELYEDGIKRGKREGKVAGKKEGRILTIERILTKKLNENDRMKEMIKKASSKKLDEIENRFFEINSWKDVENILF